MTLTTERMAEIAKLAIRLQQISSCAAVTSSGETVLHHTHVDEILSALHDVTAELLANREAQPVAWRHDNGPFAGMAITRAKSVADSWIAKGWTVTPLYTAPPAPAVPGEMAGSLESIANKYQTTIEQAQFIVVGWNACRAAMLAQPVSQRYTLPPHVYRELVNSLRDTAVKFSGTEQLRERLNTALSQFIEPDHPHSRIVAPEGGNG
ncbi:hypothetical protein QZQ15_09760 [Serratia marcescens]|uniref:hypothetical protein n=1 Tax=Serratia marcescens TaxID=615 RepID=UPI002792C1F2|nr:hypothetical protein [Serratia marcescens]MDP8798277.1 hypothetical protein [Serratia marcescens]